MELSINIPTSELTMDVIKKIFNNGLLFNRFDPMDDSYFMIRNTMTHGAVKIDVIKNSGLPAELELLFSCGYVVGDKFLRVLNIRQIGHQLKIWVHNKKGHVEVFPVYNGEFHFQGYVDDAEWKKITNVDILASKI